MRSWANRRIVTKLSNALPCDSWARNPGAPMASRSGSMRSNASGLSRGHCAPGITRTKRSRLPQPNVSHYFAGGAL